MLGAKRSPYTADLEPLLDMTLAQLELKFGSAAGFRAFMRAKLDDEIAIERALKALESSAIFDA